MNIVILTLIFFGYPRGTAIDHVEYRSMAACQEAIHSTKEAITTQLNGQLVMLCTYKGQKS